MTSGYDQNPISVPYQEPTAEQQAEWHHRAEVTDYINQVVGYLKQEVASVAQTASSLLAAYDTSTHDELKNLAHHCTTLSQLGYHSATQLTQAGVQDWVYSVKACNEVGYWASSAASHAEPAATSDSGTEIHIYLGNVCSDLTNAAASINGA